MIPKIIHYVWGADMPKPKFMRICIASWAAYMPDYEIIEWNEQRIDYRMLAEECPFFKEAYKLKIWAYVADYIRVKALYEHGGIYLDTDVQVVKSMEALRRYRLFAGFHKGFMDGRPDNSMVEGAVLGAVPGHPFFKDLLAFYQNNALDSAMCYMPQMINHVLKKKYGLTDKIINCHAELKEGITLFPYDYFHPLVNDEKQHTLTPSDILTPNSYTIHWHGNSYSSRQLKRNPIKAIRTYLFMNYRSSSSLTKIRMAAYFVRHFVIQYLKDKLKRIR